MLAALLLPVHAAATETTDSTAEAEAPSVQVSRILKEFLLISCCFQIFLDTKVVIFLNIKAIFYKVAYCVFVPCEVFVDIWFWYGSMCG